MKLIAAVLLTAVAATAPEIRYFRYQRAVQVPGNASGQTCVALDAEMFEHSAEGLDDLRLYRGETETPFVWKNAREVSAAEQSVAPVNAGRRGGTTVFDAQMPESMYSDLTLDVGGHDFLATVTVFGGQDAVNVKTRIGTYTIFDFTSQKLGRSTVLHLPPSNFSWLHFEIVGPVAPEQVRKVEAPQLPQEALKYAVVSATSKLKQNGRDTVIELTTPANVLVDRVVFEPPTEPTNFSRDVQIEIRPDTGSKRAYTAEDSTGSRSGSVLRVHTEQNGHRIDEERLSVDIPGVSFGPAKWRIAVENGDDAPIQFQNARLEMRERDVCFEAASGAGYVLYYDDAALTAPKYDYGAWFAPHADSVTAALGPEMQNTAYQRRPDMRPFTEKHPALLWIALLAVVGVLGLIALRSAKRAQKPPAMP